MYKIVHKLYKIVQKIVQHVQRENGQMQNDTKASKLYKLLYKVVQFVRHCHQFVQIIKLLYKILYNVYVKGCTTSI